MQTDDPKVYHYLIRLCMYILTDGDFVITCGFRDILLDQLVTLFSQNALLTMLAL